MLTFFGGSCLQLCGVIFWWVVGLKIGIYRHLIFTKYQFQYFWDNEINYLPIYKCWLYSRKKWTNYVIIWIYNKIKHQIDQLHHKNIKKTFVKIQLKKYIPRTKTYGTPCTLHLDEKNRPWCFAHIRKLLYREPMMPSLQVGIKDIREICKGEIFSLTFHKSSWNVFYRKILYGFISNFILYSSSIKKKRNIRAKVLPTFLVSN